MPQSSHPPIRTFVLRQGRVSNAQRRAVDTLLSVYGIAYAPGALNGAPISAQVDVMEPMGSEIYLYLVAGKSSFVARVDPRSQGRPGKPIDVMVNLDHVHVFDKETELAIR